MQINAPNQPLPGFEHISRSFNATSGRVLTSIRPGEYYVSRESELLIATVGTSCVVCLSDPKSDVAAMLHFMYPMVFGKREADDFCRMLMLDVLVGGFSRAGGHIRTSSALIVCGGRVDAEPPAVSAALHAYSNAWLALGPLVPDIDFFRYRHDPVKVSVDSNSGSFTHARIDDRNGCIETREADHLAEIRSYSEVYGPTEAAPLMRNGIAARSKTKQRTGAPMAPP